MSHPGLHGEELRRDKELRALSVKQEVYSANRQKLLALENQPGYKSVQLARDQLANFKKYFEPIILGNLKDDRQYRREDREQYLKYYRELEGKLVSDIRDADPEFRAEQAKQDVSQQYGLMRNSEERRLDSYGVKPREDSVQASELRRQNAEEAAKSFSANNAYYSEKDRKFASGNALLGRSTGLQRPAINTNIPINPNQIMNSYSQANANRNAAALGQQRIGLSQGRMAGQFATGITGLALRANNSGYFSGGGGRNSAPINQGYGGGGIRYADGGEVEAEGQGGMVENYGLIRGQGDGDSDSIPAGIITNDGVKKASVSNGEYKIPREVVDAKGSEFFDKLIEKYHTPVAGV